MQTTTFCLISLAVACACTATPIRVPRVPTPLRQQQEPAPRAAGGRADGQVAVPIGVGFTKGPRTHLIAGAVDFPVGQDWSLGPALDFGVTDDRTLVSAMLQARRYIPLTTTDRLLPYAHGGVGFAFLEDDAGPRSRDDSELLLALGGGVRYSLTDRVSLGSQVQWNFLPGELLDERFYFTWQVAQVVLTF